MPVLSVSKKGHNSLPACEKNEKKMKETPFGFLLFGQTRKKNTQAIKREI